MKRYIYVSLALLTILSINAPTLSACSCLPQPLAKKVEAAALVFEGKVLNIDYQNRNEGTPDPSSRALFFNKTIYEFELKRLWKGKEESKTITVLTNDNSAACGTTFEMYQTYIVYAYEIKDQYNKAYSTGLCQFNELTNLITVNSLNKIFKKK